MLESIDTSYLIGYGQSLISSSLTGDITAIVIIAIAAIILVALVFGVSAFLFGLIKRFFIVIIIGLSVFFFLTNYGAKLASEGPTGQLIVMGVIGIAGAVVALIIALGALVDHTKKRGEGPAREELFKEIDAQQAVKPSAPGFTPTQLQQPLAYTTQALTPSSLMNSLKDDRSLLAVFSYVIISQFGVFSSKTISAPNPETGMIFGAIFFIGAFIFIKTTYHSYLKGISHLIAATVFGAIVSIGLGIFWAEIPMNIMLSTTYFETTAMVALVTGIAISLLMGTRN